MALLLFSRAGAYTLLPGKWSTGTDVVMHLQLGSTGTQLQDGFASWNASAADALALWNQHINAVKLGHVMNSSVPKAKNDGINSVFFSNSVYGQGFGGALAITLIFSEQFNSSRHTETDVIFNSGFNWNSYRGPVQGSGRNRVWDLHRVALHEFGHVLGLGHPDEAGQGTGPIMTSYISDVDALQFDDIQGAKALYTVRITSPAQVSAMLGSDFAYQITADFSVLQYSAVPLPGGLTFDPVSGLISGRPTAAGNFQVALSATGGAAFAEATLNLSIQGRALGGDMFPQFLVGEAMNYQIVADNQPTRYKATNLPPGLALDETAGIVSGIPTWGGDFQVPVLVEGQLGPASGTIQMHIRSPFFTSSPTLETQLGDPVTFRLSATHNAHDFQAIDLPPGLQLDPFTGVISGTPTMSGSFLATLKAKTDYNDATGYLGFWIYAPYLTSASPPAATLGSPFSFQITASNRPTKFSSSTPLPPGLTLNETTGEISGNPSLSGSFSITVTAAGEPADATGYITILVEIPRTPPLAEIAIVGGIRSLLADPVRPRIYVFSGTHMHVVDSNTLAVVQTVDTPDYVNDAEIAPDGSRIWLAQHSFENSLMSLDLNTFSFSPPLPLPFIPSMLSVRPNGEIYASEYATSFARIDPVLRTVRERIFDNRIRTSELSRDGNTFFVRGWDGPKSYLWRYSVAGGAPVLQQTIETSEYISAIFPDHTGVALAVILGTYDQYRIQQFSQNNLNIARGKAIYRVPTNLTYSRDDALMFVSRSGAIDVYDNSTPHRIRVIDMPLNAYDAPLVVDSSDRYLFVGERYGPYPLKVYPTRPAPPVRPPPPPQSLLNVSTRTSVLTGDSVMIGGFIIQGDKPKTVVVRAIGPFLTDFGVQGVLADPLLQLYDAGGQLVETNDSWNEHRNEVKTSGLEPIEEREATIIRSLDPGAYTAIVRGVSNTTGVGLVEVYDLDAQNSRLANISTRGRVGLGDNVMIAGFILGGELPTQVLVRVLGPSLAQHGVTGALQDPAVELRDANGALVRANDNWQTDSSAQALRNLGFDPDDNREAAVAITVAPGAYTAIVRGTNNTTGVALVEVYNLEAP